MLVEFAQVAEREELSIGEEEDVVGESPELIGVVGDPHDRHSAVGDLTAEVLHRSASLAVECCGGFIGQQHLRSGEQCSRDRHALGLPAAQPVGRPIEQLRRQSDVFEDVTGPLVRHVRVGHAEVVVHRSGEHRCLLEHHADVPAQGGRIPVAEIASLEGDGASDRVVEPIEQANQC